MFRNIVLGLFLARLLGITIAIAIAITWGWLPGVVFGVLWLICWLRLPNKRALDMVSKGKNGT